MDPQPSTSAGGGSDYRAPFCDHCRQIGDHVSRNCPRKEKCSHCGSKLKSKTGHPSTSEGCPYKETYKVELFQADTAPTQSYQLNGFSVFCKTATGKRITQRLTENIGTMSLDDGTNFAKYRIDALSYEQQQELMTLYKESKSFSHLKNVTFDVTVIQTPTGKNGELEQRIISWTCKGSSDRMKKSEEFYSRLKDQGFAMMMSENQEKIREAALDDSLVTLIVAPTGTGKSTIVARHLMDCVKDHVGNVRIIELEPRRNATNCIGELQTVLSGKAPGVEVSVRTKVSKIGKMKSSALTVATSGIFLNELNDKQGKFWLVPWDVVIIDEVHAADPIVDTILLVLGNCLNNEEAVAQLKKRGPRVILLTATPTDKVKRLLKNPHQIQRVEFEEKTPFVSEVHYIPETEERRRTRRGPGTGAKKELWEVGEMEMVKRVKKIVLESILKPRLNEWRKKNQPKTSAEVNQSMHTNPWPSRDVLGDIVVIMSGQSEIELLYDEMKADLRAPPFNLVDFIAFHGKNATSTGTEVFNTTGVTAPRIIATTEIAGMSVTFPDSTDLVDPGRQKHLYYVKATNGWQLVRDANTEQEHAQRFGRGGRTRNDNIWCCYSVETSGETFKPDEGRTSQLVTGLLTSQLLNCCICGVSREYLETDLALGTRNPNGFYDGIAFLEHYGALKSGQFVATSFGSKLVKGMSPAEAYIMASGCLCNIQEEAALACAIIQQEGKDCIRHFRRNEEVDENLDEVERELFGGGGEGDLLSFMHWLRENILKHVDKDKRAQVCKEKRVRLDTIEQILIAYGDMMKFHLKQGWKNAKDDKAKRLLAPKAVCISEKSGFSSVDKLASILLAAFGFCGYRVLKGLDFDENHLPIFEPRYFGLPVILPPEAPKSEMEPDQLTGLPVIPPSEVPQSEGSVVNHVSI